MKVSCVTNEEEFLSLKDEWDNLLEKSSANTIFLTWEWLFSWWKSYKNGQKLLILIARDENQHLVGIAPFMINKKPRFPCLFLKTIQFIGSGKGGSDYLDFIIIQDKEEEILNLFFNYLKKYPSIWNLIELSDIVEDSTTLKIIEKILKKRRLRIQKIQKTVCPYITLPKEWDLYLQSLSKKMYKNVTYQIRRLVKNYQTKFEICNDINQLEDTIEKFLELHKLRFQSSLDLRWTNFIKEFATRFFEKGWLKLTSFKINDEPVAMLFDFIYSEKEYYFQSGFNPEWSKFSVGTVLIGLCIKDAISRGLREFDFLKGTEEYKYNWTSKERKTMQVFIIRVFSKAELFYLKEKMRCICKKLLKNKVILF